MICAIALCLPCCLSTESSFKSKGKAKRSIASNHPQQRPSKTKREKASSVVDQYIRVCEKQKNYREYSSGFYRKYIAGSISKPADQSRSEIVYREGKIQFDTLTLREIYATGRNDGEDPEKVEENELRIGKPFVVPREYVVYSLGEERYDLESIHRNFFKRTFKWKWKKATDYKRT